MEKKTLAILLLLLVLSVPVRGEDDPRRAAADALAFRISRDFWSGRDEDALAGARDYYAEYFDQNGVDEVSGLVARIRLRNPELAEAADDVLRTALNSHPFEGRVSYVREAVDSTRIWTFGDRDGVGEYRKPDAEHGAWLSVKRWGPGTATNRVFRIPPDLYASVAKGLGVSWKSWPDREDALRALVAYREEWQLVTERAFTAGPGPERESVEPLLARPGLCVWEREIDGFRELVRFRVARWLPLVRCLAGEAIVFVASPWDGGPVPDARLTLFRRDGSRVFTTTGPGGLARFTDVEDARLVVEGEDDAFSVPFVAPEPEDWPLDHVATDRPVYRPGETVHYRIVRRYRREGRLELPAETTLSVELIRYGEEGPVRTTKRPVSSFGTVCGSFVIPEDAEANTFAIRVEETWPPTGSFRVVDFERPDVSLSVEPVPGARLLGEPVEVVVRASHWWGAPAAGVAIRYETWGAAEGDDDGTPPTGRWQRRPFPDPRSDFYGGDAPVEYGRTVESLDAEGDAVTGADGTVRISLPTPPLDAPVRISVSAEAVGDSGRPVGADGAVIARPAALVVRAGTTRMFYEPGAPVEAGVLVTDLDGRPQPGREVALAIARGTVYGETVEFEPGRRLAGTSGPDGFARFSFEAPPSGRLRVDATAPDGHGRVARDRADVWIASPDTVRAVDRKDGNDAFLIVPDRAAYAPGETARILVDHPDLPCAAWFTLAGDRYHESRIVRLTRRFQVIEVPIRAEYAPGVDLKFVAFHSGYRDGVDVDDGGTGLVVLPLDGAIDVVLGVSPDSPGPRERVTVRVATSRNGTPVPAELEIAVVDEAVLALAADGTPTLSRFFSDRYESEEYEWGPEGFYLDTTNGRDWIETARNYDPGHFFAEEEGPAVRRNFPPTAFWRGDVTTGEDGTAEVTFDAPDTLTGWRVIARAVAGAESFGGAERRVVTTQRVVARIAAPPSLTERDESRAIVSVRSDLDVAAEFRVSLDVSGAAEGGGAKSLRLDPGTEGSVSFPLRAMGEGEARLLAKAVSDAGSDAIEVVRPVRGHGTTIRREMSGVADPDWKGEIVLPTTAAPAAARLTIRADTIPSLLRRARPQLVEWGRTYGGRRSLGPEAAAWRVIGLLRIALLTGRLDDVRADLEAELVRIGAEMRPGGNFADRGETYGKVVPTAAVVLAFAEARDAGLAIPTDTLDRAVKWLGAGSKAVPFAAYACSRAGPGATPTGSWSVENSAWLALAGYDGELGEIPEGPTDGADPAVVAALAAAGDPRFDAWARALVGERTGDAWPDPMATAKAVFALSFAADAAAPGGETATVNGHPVAFADGFVRIAGSPLAPGPNEIALSSPEGRRFVAVRLDAIDPAAEDLGPIDDGVRVERRLDRFVRLDEKEGEIWEPLRSDATVKAGERLRFVLDVRPPRFTRELALECPLPGGAIARSGEGPHERGAIRRTLHDVPIGGRLVTVELLAVFPGDYHAMPASTAGGRSSEIRLRIAPRR